MVANLKAKDVLRLFQEPFYLRELPVTLVLDLDSEYQKDHFQVPKEEDTSKGCKLQASFIKF